MQEGLNAVKAPLGARGSYPGKSSGKETFRGRAANPVTA
jgi:hypothetical protein